MTVCVRVHVRVRVCVVGVVVLVVMCDILGFEIGPIRLSET